MAPDRPKPLHVVGILGDLANSPTMQRKHCVLRHATQHHQYIQTQWTYLHATVSHRDTNHYYKYYECEVCGNNLTTLNNNPTYLSISTNVART